MNPTSATKMCYSPTDFPTYRLMCKTKTEKTYCEDLNQSLNGTVVSIAKPLTFSSSSSINLYKEISKTCISTEQKTEQNQEV